MTAVDTPRVSVVIPTRGRPRELVRAIRSVLRQTFSDFEVVVVVDGPDEVSASIALKFGDDRVRVVQLSSPRGGGAARNAGVEAAQGKWISFLDDDDEFLPPKLKRQLALADNGPAENLLIACKACVVAPVANSVWPRRFPAAGEKLCRYLFIRNQLRQGEAFLQTSTFLLSRKLALNVPFRDGLTRHQDWDWILRLESAGVRVAAVEEPLVIYHAHAGPSVSRAQGWLPSFEWGREAVKPRDRKAYAFFLATQCVSRLSGEECCSPVVICPLVREFLQTRPSAFAMRLFLGFWFRTILRSIGAWVAGTRQSAPKHYARRTLDTVLK